MSTWVKSGAAGFGRPPAQKPPRGPWAPVPQKPRRPQWTRAKKVLLISLLGLVVLAALAPIVGRRIVERMARNKIEARLGQPVRIGAMRFRWKAIELVDVDLGQLGGIDKVVVRKDEILVDHPRLRLTPELLTRLRGKSREPAARPDEDRSAAGRHVRVVAGTLAYVDAGRKLDLNVGNFEADLVGKTGRVSLGKATGKLPLGATMSAAGIEVALADGKPSELKLADVSLGLEKLLRLTHISGSVLPQVALSGSLGSLTQAIWQATGSIDVATQEIDVVLAAKPVPLDVLEPIWGPALSGHNVLIAPERANVSGEVSIRTTGPLAKAAERTGDADAQRQPVDGTRNRIDLQGHAEVTGLSVGSKALGKQPVHGLSISARFGATLFPKEKRFELGRAVLNHLGAELAISGELDLGGAVPRLALHLEVPKAACQNVLAALPRPFVPAIADFKLEGQFDTDIVLKVDMADIQGLVLDGHVGIDGCKVLSAPPDYSAERLMAPFDHRVEVEPGREIDFSIGPDNPEFTPFSNISPYIPNSLMTSEDNQFFKHHGFVTSEFRTALVRNLEHGAFRLGASSITMQTVKNVLLGREKTISRKLQELFLTWYIEQKLPKQRIFEIYLNAIEFGPGIYGIGRAMRHYFGKTPAEATPKEAAFFSTILPSPKRRYVHYCHGSLSDKWENYVERLLRRMRDRGRLTEEEYSEATSSKLVFDRTEAKSEKECMEYVKHLTEGGPKDEERDLKEAGVKTQVQ